MIHGKGFILALAKMKLVHITRKGNKRYDIYVSHNKLQMKIKRERCRENYM